jgi:hypothetical protein
MPRNTEVFDPLRHHCTPGPASAISPQPPPGMLSRGTPPTTCRAASASCTTRSSWTGPSAPCSGARSTLRLRRSCTGFSLIGRALWAPMQHARRFLYQSGSIRLTPQPGSALDDRRAGPGSGQTHRQRDRAGSAHGPAHGVPNCLSGRALTSSRPQVVQKLLTVWTFRHGGSHGHVTRRRELVRRPDFRRSACVHRPRDRSHPGSTGWRQPE